MRWISAVGAALVLAACMEAAPVARVPGPGGSGGPSGGSAPGGSASGGSSVPAGAAVQEMVQLVNEFRRSRGCGPLAWLQPAADAAQGHSDDMARRNYFDHVSPEGQRPWDRLVARGVQYRSMAENIAWSPEQTPRQTLRGWTESAGHRQNLENCAYTHHGIGLRDAYWTHVFVTPAPPPRS